MAGWACFCAALSVSADAVVQIRRFEPESNVCRAGRPETVVAVIENMTEREVAVQTKYTLPEGVKLLPPVGGATSLSAGGQALIRCQVEAAAACDGELVLEVASEGQAVGRSALRVRFLPPLERRKLSAIPPPAPVRTEMLVGAHHCPLWESDKPAMWNNVLLHPERTPALGFYSQENPEVSDWETKWAVEHGVSFFIYCWYRTSQGCPVKTQFSSAIHDALFKSRFVDRMKFTIMWENQSVGSAGVADEKDLFGNLLPFWIESYFKHPSYLKVDNKPVLFVYRPEFLIQDLGSVENVGRAFAKMRQTCKDAGFDGLWILGEYRGLEANHLEMMKKIGLDSTFAYCWYIPDNPSPEQAIATQMGYIRKTQELGILPQVITVSQAWSGWQDEGTIWKIPPAGFKTLLGQAKAVAETLPEGSLGRRMLLLDNWNEWGEGHYIAPYREYGFGYLDAVREVFAPAAGPHVDLLPEDVGLGPYDTAIRKAFAEIAKDREQARQYAVKPGAEARGLVGWWAFDEKGEEPVTVDYSGKRHGGRLLGAARAPGIDGNALLCTGGCVRVESDPAFSVTNGVTVSCWVRTERAAQSQAWIVNRIQGGGEATGYRLGLMEGRPCFNVPQTPWSHLVYATNALPVGRWVHLAGTCDGQVLRIYVDGERCGELARVGPVGTNGFPLILGSFAAGHAAHFEGLLDEVKLYNRALTPQEILNLYVKGVPVKAVAQ